MTDLWVLYLNDNPLNQEAYCIIIPLIIDNNDTHHFSFYRDPNPYPPGSCIDSDGDGVNDYPDNCPGTPNPNQEDTFPPESNGIGDACECEGNFNCSEDQDVDGSDSIIFKLDFGRNAINRPCSTNDSCNGDFSCDGDVDGIDAALFKADFGRSAIQNPCPVCVSGGAWCSYPLP